MMAIVAFILIGIPVVCWLFVFHDLFAGTRSTTFKRKVEVDDVVQEDAVTIDHGVGLLNTDNKQHQADIKAIKAQGFNC